MIKLMRFQGASYDVVHIPQRKYFYSMHYGTFCKKNHVKKIIVHSHCAAEHKTLKYQSDQDGILPIYHECTDGLLCLLCGSR